MHARRNNALRCIILITFLSTCCADGYSKAERSTKHEAHDIYMNIRRRGVSSTGEIRKTYGRNSLKQILHHRRGRLGSNEVDVRPNDCYSDEANADANMMAIFFSRIHHGGAVEKKSSSLPQQPTWKRWGIFAFIISTACIIIATQYKGALQAILDEHLDTFKSNLLKKLNNINEQQGNSGLVIYTIAFALWEGIGLVTAPIESMAGMVFGFRRAIVPNLVGKFSGALLAFGIGRVFLYDRVKAKLQDNDIMSLVEQSIQKKPIRMALLMRFFPFPELVKNLALAVMPLSFLAFAAATFMNQVAFSALWTLVGVDAASALDPNAPPSSMMLRICVLCVAIFGIVGSPAFLALYLNGLRKGTSS